MTTEREAVGTTSPADVGLRREIGLVGAIWSSETTIIGSGWLFGAWYAATAAGTAALLGWVIGGAAIIILAPVHAELAIARIRSHTEFRPISARFEPEAPLRGLQPLIHSHYAF